MRQNYLTEHIKDKYKIVSIQEKVKYERKNTLNIMLFLAPVSGDKTVVHMVHIHACRGNSHSYPRKLRKK